jgi:BlaI family penicillinase repressor
MHLSKKEEELMELIWKGEKLFMKDIIESYKGEKPAVTTVATLLKRMQDKGFIGFNLYGNSREYYPLVKKSDYFSKQVREIIKNYFENSSLEFASFFTKNSNLSEAQLQELKKIVEEEIKRKKK